MWKRGIQDAISWNCMPWAAGSKLPYSGSATRKPSTAPISASQRAAGALRSEPGGQHHDARDDREPDDETQERQTGRHGLLLLCRRRLQARANHSVSSTNTPMIIMKA